MMARTSLFAAGLLTLAAAFPVAGSEPIDIVHALYAGHPWATQPPGGMEVWHPLMQERWAELNKDEQRRIAGEAEWSGEGLVFDFMTGTQESWFDDLKIKTVIRTEGEAMVSAVMNTGADQPFTVHYGFVHDEEEGWLIIEVRTEDWFLSELIDETH